MSATQANQEKFEIEGGVIIYECGCIECNRILFTPKQAKENTITSMNASIAFNHSKDDCENCSNKNKQPEEPHWTPSNSGTQTTGSQEQTSSLTIPITPWGTQSTGFLGPTSVTIPVFPSDD